MSASAARKTTSGQHPEVRALRAKLDSMSEGTLPLVRKLRARIEASTDDLKEEVPDLPRESLEKPANQ